MPASLPRIAVLAAIAAVLAAVLPVAGTALGPHASFLPAFLTAAAGADALTAYLLAQQWRAGASARILALGAAYAFSSFTIVVHALVFPTVVSPTGLLGAYNDTSTWLWTTWHGGFSLFLAAALGPWPERFRAPVRRLTTGNRTAASALAFTAPALLTTALTAVFIGLHDHLPQIISANDYSKLTRTIGPFVIGANVIALAAVIAGTRRGDRPQLERWVVVVTAASFADVVLTLLADGRFTLGWYAARVLSLAAASIVLVVLLTEIRRMYREMTIANERLARKASRDSLTGVLARGAALERLGERLADPADDRPFLVGLLDIDHFKAINDGFGHVAGDRVLSEVARRLELRLRGEDLLGRYGGEEFLLVLEADPRHAAAIGERLLDGLRELPVIVDDGHDARAVDVRASLGLVKAQPGDDVTTLIARADEALYRAKKTGRDHAEVFRPVALAAA
ncbi:MAG TPA: sensor domain-containing diguanylate cyclase [Solirubrobacteraceae bacterium]|nr:sensor domain-containing diguanylate cyclase [Solirubrobacteraceae bacterium]